MYKVGPLFIHKKAEKLFYRNGYAIIPFLSSNDAEYLLNQYFILEKEHLQIDIPFISTSHSNNPILIEKVDQLILSKVSPLIAEVIPNSLPIFSNFLIKRKGENSASPAHQDMTFVDEKKYYSFSIWIPLQDVDEENGCMKVLEGSHLFPTLIRSNPLKDWKYRLLKHSIESDMKPCPMKKGEALVFSHSLIHGSFPNLSAYNRIAVVIACCIEGANLWHYETDTYDSSVAYQYAMSKEAYISYVKGMAPAKGAFKKKVILDLNPMSALQYNWLKFKIKLQNLFTH